MDSNLHKKFIVVSKICIYGIIAQLYVYTFAFAVGGNAQPKSVDEIPVSISIRGSANLFEVLEKIERTTEFKFSYINEELDSYTLNLDLRFHNLGDLLRAISLQTGLSFKRVDETIYIKHTAQKSEPVIEEIIREVQDTTLTGQVTDENGEPLPGATVAVKGTASGTITDVDGHYSLQVPEDAQSIVLSFVGYKTQEVALNGQTVINVSLEVDFSSLEEVVVVGYGTQKKESVTGAIKQIEGKGIEDQPIVQTSAALMGKVAGVQVIQDSGQPGANQGTIRIRGTGTLGNANPLILIDGVAGDLNNVASSDIASMTILKDASSAAIYGSRAANGVILVTTKRGQSGSPKVNYRGFYGWQKPTDQPEYVDGATYMKLQNMAASNVGNQPVWTDTYIQEWEGNHTNDPDNYPNTNWVDEVFSEPGFQQRQHLDISGGSEMIRYFGSINYDEENGNIPNYGFKRYAIRLNTDINVSDKLGFVVDMNLQRSDRQQPVDEAPGIEGILNQAFRLPPLSVSQYSNGGWGFGWNGQNPVAFANGGGFETTESSLVNLRLNALFQPIEVLDFEIMYAPKFRSAFQRSMVKQFDVVDADGNFVQSYPNQNSLSEFYSRDFIHNANFTIRYHETIGDHNLNILGGTEYIEYQNDFFNAYRDNFTIQDFEQLNAGSAANQQNAGSAESWALQSFFGRASYEFKSKYLIETTMRYDGSSRFTEDNRWGFFPSVSAGWVISEESFLQSIGIISNLKIRGSWGKLGNQQIGTYPFASVIDLGQNFIFGGSTVSGGAQLDLANSNVSWEETTSKNIGLDGSFFDNRFYASFDVFERTTKDILLELPVPLIIGLNAPFQNAGEVSNKGWEMEMGYSGNIGNDFRYGVSFNISRVKNEVIDLKGAGPFINNNTIIQEGYPINAIYGYKTSGLFQSQEEVDSHATQAGQVGPGDIRYVDITGDDIINAEDKTVIGDPFPSMNYGINLSAKYKGFDVAALIQGVGDRDVMLYGAAVWPLSLNIQKWQAEDFWTEENTSASYPRLTPSDGNNHRASDYWVYNAAYLRLRNFQVGYTLPADLTNRISIDKARFFLLGQNLFTLFDDLPPGVDPNVPGLASGDFYPVTRLYSVGIDLTF